MPFTFHISISFPALAALVEFLKTSRAQQEAIDALTAKVEALTAGLSQSNTNLEGEINNAS